MLKEVVSWNKISSDALNVFKIGIEDNRFVRGAPFHLRVSPSYWLSDPPFGGDFFIPLDDSPIPL